MLKNTAFLLLFVVSSCGSSTYMVDSWAKYPKGEKHFDKISVIAILNDIDNRKKVEAKLEEHLSEKGYNIMPGFLILPPNSRKADMNKELVLGFLESNDIDAVLTVSVLGVNDTRRYNPPVTYVGPSYGYGAGFWDYYGGAGAVYYAPGGYSGSLNIYVESKLFDLHNNELIWQGETKAEQRTNLDQIIGQFAVAVTKELDQKKVLAP